MPDFTRKIYVQIGTKVQMEIAFSEAAMSMGIAGKILEVELLPSRFHGAIAQVYRDGQPYSFPILTGEAGFYRDGQGFYFYPPEKTLA